MDRDGAAARTEPSESTPSLSQTAANVGATARHEPDDLYISYLDQSKRSSQPNNSYTPYSTSSSVSSPTIGISPIFPNEQPSTTSWRPNAFEIVANEAMSRQTAQGGSRPPAQYQLKSSESPADQARSLSQVSPGFIFVIFPLSCDYFATLLFSLSLCLLSLWDPKAVETSLSLLICPFLLCTQGFERQ